MNTPWTGSKRRCGGAIGQSGVAFQRRVDGALDWHHRGA